MYEIQVFIEVFSIEVEWIKRFSHIVRHA